MTRVTDLSFSASISALRRETSRESWFVPSSATQAGILMCWAIVVAAARESPVHMTTCFPAFRRLKIPCSTPCGGVSMWLREGD